jgi:hypothetical protein
MSESKEKFSFVPFPTGSDLELVAYLAEDARGFPILEAQLEECGCPICKEAIKRLRGGN